MIQSQSWLQTRGASQSQLEASSEAGAHLQQKRLHLVLKQVEADLVGQQLVALQRG